MYRHHPQTRVSSSSSRRARSARCALVRDDVQLLARRRANVRCAAGAGGRSADGRRLLLRQRLAAARRRAGRCIAEQVVGPTGVDMALFGTLRFPGDVVAQFDGSFVAPKRSASRSSARAACSSSAAFRIDWPGDVRILHAEEASRAGCRRRTPTAWSSRTWPTRSQAPRRRSSTATTRSARHGAIDALYRSARRGSRFARPERPGGQPEAGSIGPAPSAARRGTRVGSRSVRFRYRAVAAAETARAPCPPGRRRRRSRRSRRP